MKTKSARRRFLILAGSLLTCVTAAHAQTDTAWNGTAGDNDWQTAGNWSDGVPTASLNANIFAVGSVVNINSAATAGTINVKSDGAGERPVLNIAADVTSGRIQVGRDLAALIGAGLVNQTAGTVTLSGSTWSTRIGDEGGVGEYRMSGGTLNAANRYYVGVTGTSAPGDGTFLA